MVLSLREQSDGVDIRVSVSVLADDVDVKVAGVAGPLDGDDGAVGHGWVEGAVDECCWAGEDVGVGGGITDCS